MDLITTLAGALGVPAEQAKAVAGLALGATRTQVADGDAKLAGQLEAAVPELSDWEAAAAAQTATAPAPSGGGMFGGLMAAASGGLGNQLLGAVAGQSAAQGAALVGLLSKLGLSAEHAGLAAPILLQFLEARLGKEQVASVLSFAPMLASGASLLGR